MSAEPLRWSLNRAAEEFGFARQTVKNRMVSRAVKPGADGCYSTAEVVAALFGDLAGEKLRKLRAEADLAELERDERTRSLIAAEVVSMVWTDALTNLRAIVMAADIPKVTRAQLIKQLQEIPLCDYKEPAAQDGEDDSAEVA